MNPRSLLRMSFGWFGLVCLGSLGGLTGCVHQPAVFNSTVLHEMDTAITNAIAEKRCPGGVLWLEHAGQEYHQAYGHRALEPQLEPMTLDTIFDLASLTKVVACTPAMMLLIERGQVKLDDPVCKFIPEFSGGGKEKVTVRQLMTHTSGLRPDVSTRPPWKGYDTAIQLACAEKLRTPPGTAFRYSDINFFLLGDIVRRVSGMGLETFVEQEIYRPLKMKDTGFLPPKSKLARIAPTQRIGTNWLRGVVHDPTSRYMGGVAGHAGVFSTAADLARYARMLLNGGELDGVRLFKPETVQLMTSVQTPPSVPARRGLGWDIDSGYSRPRGELFPLGSYGHTGFTGTCLWIDPFSRTFYIFLSNRVHPNGKGNILPLEARLGTLAAEAVKGFNFTNVPGALPSRQETSGTPTGSASSVPARPVLNGIDVLVKQKFAPLKKMRVGLITNQTGRDRQGTSTIDRLKNAPDVSLVALFSPEHGIRGALDERVGDNTDTKTGLPIYSLYGQRRAPSLEQLQGLDALVFDIQDIGCRFYTFISTMGLCMEAAANAKVKFVVLDRVNPINGVTVEGPVYHGESKFIAFHALPLRHGMTVGELARMFNADRGWKADLTVIPLEGWKRTDWMDETGLPWVNPSPNMRSLRAATIYPGLGLLETALSVGRGTETPFELFGAPYIDGLQLAAALNGAGLAGVQFEAIRFTPTYSTFKDQPCGGVSITVTDRNHFQAVDAGLEIALTLQRLYPGKIAIDKLQTLLLDREVLAAVKAGRPLAQIKELWKSDLANFQARRKPFLIYD